MKKDIVEIQELPFTIIFENNVIKLMAETEQLAVWSFDDTENLEALACRSHVIRTLKAVSKALKF